MIFTLTIFILITIWTTFFVILRKGDFFPIPPIYRVINQLEADFSACIPPMTTICRGDNKLEDNFTVTIRFTTTIELNLRIDTTQRTPTYT